MNRQIKNHGRRIQEEINAWCHYAMTLVRMISRPRSLQRVMVPNAGIHTVIWVDPNKIRYAASVAIKPRRGSRFFAGDDWDARKTPMTEVEKDNPKYITCRQILIERVCYEETAEFKLLANLLESKGSYRGCRNIDDVRRYIEKLAKVYSDIRDYGYFSRAQLGGSRYSGEIECALDRSGNLIKINAGNHRFAAARVLGLKSVPVQLCFVHDNHFPTVAGRGRFHFLRDLNAFIKTIERQYS